MRWLTHVKERIFMKFWCQHRGSTLLRAHEPTSLSSAEEFPVLGIDEFICRHCGQTRSVGLRLYGDRYWETRECKLDHDTLDKHYAELREWIEENHKRAKRAEAEYGPEKARCFDDQADGMQEALRMLYEFVQVRSGRTVRGLSQKPRPEPGDLEPITRREE